MAKKTREAKKAKRIKASTPVAEAGIPYVEDDRTTYLRILDNIAEKLLYAIIFFVPFAFMPETYWLFDIPKVVVLRILTVIVLVVYFMRIAVAGEWKIIRPPMMIPILLYIAAYFISTLLSISPNLSLHSGEGRNFGLIALLNMVLIYFLVINIMTDRRQLMQCLQLLLGSSVVVAVLGILQYYYHDAGWFDDNFRELVPMMGSRASSTFGNPDFLLAFLVLPVFISFAFLLRKQWVYFVPLILCIWCLVLALPTLFRDKTIDFLVVFGIFLVFLAVLKIPLRLIVHYSLLITLIVGILLGCNVLDSRDKIVHFAENHLGLDEDDDRSLLSSIALDTVNSTKEKFVGSGPNTFRNTFTQDVTLEYSKGKPNRREDKVHNSFVEAYATTGWLGLISYVVMVISILCYLLLCTLRGIKVKGKTLKFVIPAVILVGIGVIVASIGSIGWLGFSSFCAMLFAALWFVLLWLKWMLEEKPEMAFVAMIFAGGLVYIASSYSLFHTVVPYTLFWISVAAGMGICIKENPRTIRLQFGISKAFAHSVAGLMLVIGCLGIFLISKPLVANASYYKAHDVENRQTQVYYQEYYPQYFNELQDELAADRAARDKAASDAALDALPHFKKAYEWNGSETRYSWSYSHVLLRAAAQNPNLVQDNCNEAQRIMTESLKREPESAMLYYNRAAFRDSCEGGIASDATLSDLQESLILYPYGYLTLQFYGEAQTVRGNLEPAIAADELALYISPDYPDIWIRLGGNYLALGAQYLDSGDPEKAQEQYEGAVRNMEQAVERYPDDAGMHYYLGVGYQKSGRIEDSANEFESALSLLETLVEATPENSDVHYLMGAVYESTGDLEKAREKYEKALELNPNSTRAKDALESLG